MDITVIKNPVDQIRLATILDEAFGVVEPALTTEQLLSRLEAELFARRQIYEAEREAKEAYAGELAAWRSGALSLADCTCNPGTRRANGRRDVHPRCPVHGSPRRSARGLPVDFVSEVEQLAARLREPKGSNICARDREMCITAFEELVRRFL